MGGGSVVKMAAIKLARLCPPKAGFPVAISWINSPRAKISVRGPASGDQVVQRQLPRPPGREVRPRQSLVKDAFCLLSNLCPRSYGRITFDSSPTHNQSVQYRTISETPTRLTVPARFTMPANSCILPRSPPFRVFPNDLSSEVRGVSSESDRSSARHRSSGPSRGSFRNALWLLDGHPASYTKELIDNEPAFASPDSSKGPSRFRSPSLYPRGFRKPMPAGHRR